MEPFKPLARTRNIVVERVGDETVVYDSLAHKAHSLNRVAEAVWRLCDGKTTTEGMVDRLRSDFGPSADASTVEGALHDLSQANLLKESSHLLTRRAVSTGAVLLPVVTSILVPQPAAAKSGKVKDHHAPRQRPRAHPRRPAAPKLASR